MIGPGENSSLISFYEDPFFCFVLFWEEDGPRLSGQDVQIQEVQGPSSQPEPVSSTPKNLILISPFYRHGHLASQIDYNLSGPTEQFGVRPAWDQESQRLNHPDPTLESKMSG